MNAQTGFRTDGYVNLLNRYGTKQDSAEAYEYQAEPFTPDISLVNHYQTNGLFAKIIDIPAEEALKHGFDLQLNDPAYDKLVEARLDELEWEERAATAIKWARLFGGSIIVMLIDDGRDITEPVDWANIRSIDELRVYERPIVQPDMASLYGFDARDPLRRTASKFGMPEFYQVSSIYGTFRVHESRCLTFRNGVLPEYATQAEYRFWGMPEYARIKRALRETITTHSNAAKLMEKMVQPIYKMKGLAQLLSALGGEDQVMARLRIIDQARSILSSIAIDADREDYDFKQFQLSGVKDIVDASCNMLSALSTIPQTILYGRSPAGENSTGASDFENFYNSVEKIRNLMLKGNLRTVLDAIFRAGVNTGEIKETPDYKLTFKPLWSLNETEQAAVDQAKATMALTNAQAAQMYVDMQALDPTEVRAGLAKTDPFNVEELLDNQDEPQDDWGLGALIQEIGEVNGNGQPDPQASPSESDTAQIQGTHDAQQQAPYPIPRRS